MVASYDRPIEGDILLRERRSISNPDVSLVEKVLAEAVYDDLTPVAGILRPVRREGMKNISVRYSLVEGNNVKATAIVISPEPIKNYLPSVS